MSILKVVSIGSISGAYGGPFDTAKRQVELAQASGLSIRLWAGFLSNDEPDPSSLPEGTVLVPVRIWLPRFGFASAISFGAIASLIREVRNADSIHVSFARECLPVLTAVLALVWRKRLIIQPHGMLTSRTSRLHRVLDVVVKPLVTSSNVVIALTEVERIQLAKWTGPNTKFEWLTMGNPVGRLADVPAEARASPLAREALWVARLHPRKRVCDFVAASRISHGHGREISYVVVGPDGGDLSEVQSARDDRGALAYEGSMTSDEVTRRVSSTGVFVLTSLNEPWGNVLATALSLGVPVVVTESSALAGVIRQFGAGVIVPDRSPSDVDAAIADLLDNELRYQKCSTGAFNLSQDLLSDTVQANGLMGLYRATPD